MARIVYLGFPTDAITGGQKVIFRHVEALRALGFDAVFWTNESGVIPTWFQHVAPIEVATRFNEDDILVVPSDAPNAIRTLATLPNRQIVFCQNHFTFAMLAYESVDRSRADALPTFIAVGRITAASIARAFPLATIEIVACFVDERVFKRAPTKRAAIVYVPRKRAGEAQIIRAMFRRVHRRLADIPWNGLDGVTEEVVAQTMSVSSLFLSLARLEAVGMTALEAMACGCVVAGFTGIGGREFATPSNGFWVEEDDCEAAADALAQAADLVRNEGPRLRDYAEAAAATARAWSYANFLRSLEDVWTRQAPQARSTRPA